MHFDYKNYDYNQSTKMLIQEQMNTNSIRLYTDMHVRPIACADHELFQHQIDNLILNIERISCFLYICFKGVQLLQSVAF